MNKKLKKFPEQNPMYSYSNWGISKELCEVIDKVPSFMGVVSEDGKSVEVGYLEHKGFDSTLPLDAYLKGKLYAILKEKAGTTYIPKGLEKNVGDKIKKLQEEINYCFSNKSSFEGPAKRVWANLVEADSTK